MPTKPFDHAVETQLDLFRASKSIESDVLTLLLQMQKDLVGEVASADYTVWGKARVNKQISEVSAAISDYYDRVAEASQEGTSAIAQVAALSAVKALEITGTDPVLPSDTILESIASKAVIQGAAQGAWWAKQSDDLAFRFSQAVRQGLVQAETNQQIISRVRAFLDTSRSNAAALVQTSVATVASNGRAAVFEANRDIIKGSRALATLDTSTCMECAPLDGLEWDSEGNPVGHSYSEPMYPLHFNCRCLLLPIVLDGPPGGMRASDSDPVSASLTFSGWLDRQPASKVTEILGKGRAELYQSGKITISDLVNGNGSPLTIAQLQAKHQ